MKTRTNVALSLVAPVDLVRRKLRSNVEVATTLAGVAAGRDLEASAWRSGRGTSVELTVELKRTSHLLRWQRGRGRSRGRPQLASSKGASFLAGERVVARCCEWAVAGRWPYFFRYLRAGKEGEVTDEGREESFETAHPRASGRRNEGGKQPPRSDFGAQPSTHISLRTSFVSTSLPCRLNSSSATLPFLLRSGGPASGLSSLTVTLRLRTRLGAWSECTEISVHIFAT